MADDQQLATANLEILPFNTLDSEERRDTAIPHARTIHRGQLQLDGSGVGDTANLRLTLPLESRDIYMLNNMFLYHAASSGSLQSTYIIGWLELYLLDRPSDQFGQSTQMHIGLEQSDEYAIPQGEVKYWGPGFKQLTGNMARNPYQESIGDIGRIQYMGTELGGTSPVLGLDSGSNTNVNTDTTLFYWFEWLAYDFEQCLNMPLHYRTGVR